MIDLSKVSDKLKGNTFQYAQFVSMTDFAVGKPCRHCIKTHKKVSVVGGHDSATGARRESGRIEFETEHDARQAVADLNRWAAI